MNNVVRPTMNTLSTMLFQVVTVEQCCNNMLTILFIVGRTTLFTPVDINLQQVVDFLNFYACNMCIGPYTVISTPTTAICVQAQTANIFARLFTFETGRLPLETEMFHRSSETAHVTCHIEKP